MKLGIFCPNWVGDAVMATPALRAVRREYPAAQIVGIMSPYVADVFTGLNLFDQTVLQHARGKQAEQRGWALARRLRSLQLDTALLLRNSFRSAWWAWLSGARRRVGFHGQGRGWLLTDTIAPRSRAEPHPVLDEYLRLASALGCRRLTRQMELATTFDDEHQLRSYWRRQGCSQLPARTICLNTGGAFGGAKHWPHAACAELARRIARELDHRVLVLCGPAERDAARSIVAQANHPGVTSLADEPLSLGLTKAAIRHARLLVTTDSGPRHFAPPFDVPVITLFGPTHIAWSETYYDKSLHLQLDLDCGPCQQRQCPLQHHRCMQDLSPHWVFRGVQSLLQKYPARERAA